MKTEMMAASSSEKAFRRPSPLAIAITIAILIGAVAAAGVVSLSLVVGAFDADGPVVYGIGTLPSVIVKAYTDPDERLLLFIK